MVVVSDPSAKYRSKWESSPNKVIIKKTSLPKGSIITVQSQIKVYIEIMEFRSVEIPSHTVP